MAAIKPLGVNAPAIGVLIRRRGSEPTRFILEICAVKAGAMAAEAVHLLRA